MDSKDLYWLAGLLEGEGCFSSHRKSGYPSIVLQSSDKDIVKRAALLCGGRPITESDQHGLGKSVSTERL